MSDVLLSFRGRQIRAADVTFLREFISQNPSLSRRRLSVKVCQVWNWVQPNGQPRDMVCRYHHPIHLLESFVDIQRFRGTCYRAANWTCVGRSMGRGTKSKSRQPTCSIKELWVYPLGKHLG